jgi:hypothetical protein
VPALSAANRYCPIARDVDSKALAPPDNLADAGPIDFVSVATRATGTDGVSGAMNSVPERTAINVMRIMAPSPSAQTPDRGDAVIPFRNRDTSNDSTQPALLPLTATNPPKR